MKRQTRRHSFAILLAIFIGSIISAPFAAASDSIGGRPALPRDNEPRSQSIFIHTIKRGQAIDDKVLVANRSDKTQTIILYAVDAIPSNTGAFTCKQRVEKTTDAGGWIKLAKNEVTLKANQSDIVDFAITAPENADVGEHNACLAFESKEDDGELSGNLRIRTRSAVRVALTIPGDLRRELRIDSYTVSQQNYHQQYSISIHNIGNVSADTDVQVRLRSLFGGTVYSNGGNYPILADKSLELSYENDKSPFFGGWYFAEATAAYDKNAKTWGTQRTADLTTVYASNQLVFIWPKPLAALIILLVVGAIGWVVIWLIRQEKQRLEILNSWQSHKVKKGETIQTLADSRDVSWKKLARINQLKPPYALSANDTLYLPKKKNQTKKNQSAKKT